MIAALAAATLKATAILVAASAVALAARRRSSSLRHLIWTAGLAGAVSMFVLPALLPSWRVIPAPALAATNERPAGDWHVPPARALATAPSAPLSVPAASALAIAGDRTLVVPIAPTTRVDWSRVLVGAWLLGAAIVVMRYGWGMWMLRRLARRAADVDDTEWSALSREIAARLQLRRAVRIVWSADLAVPLTWGIVRPHVGVPADAGDWSDARRRHVLHHELAHVKRLDALTQTIAHAATALLWFHPLAWHATRRLRHERERACDDYVLQQGVVASDYAGDLLAIATAYGRHSVHPTALAIAHRSQLEGRLLALLDPSVKRGPMSLRTVAIIVSCASAIVVPVSALSTAERANPIVVGQDATLTPPPSGPSAIAAATAMEPALHTAPMQGARPPAAAPPSTPKITEIFASCTPSGSSHNSETSHSDGSNRKWSASWKSGDCSYEMTSEGHITFNRDATAIVSITAGGYIDVTTTVHGDVTHLVARGVGTGIEYTLTRNGSGADFSTEGPAWFAGFLQALNRQTAFAIDIVFPALLQDGGPSRVLDEVALVSSGTARANYLTRLLDSTVLTATEFRRALELIATLGSDHDTGRLLVGVAHRLDAADAAAQGAYLRGVSTLSSDHMFGETLLAFLAKTSPSPAQVMQILTIVERMHSDYDVARVLVDLGEKHRIDDGSRAAYLRAAARIQSDYQRQRAIAAIAR